MQKILLFIKKYKLPVALISITLIVVAVIFSAPKKSVIPVTSPLATIVPTPPSVPHGEWGALDTLTQKLGKPIGQEDTATKSGEYHYKSSTPNRDQEVVYQSNIPVFYKEIVTQTDNKTAKSIKQKYGQAEIRLYGPESDIGFYLYAYPSKGIAYVGGNDDIITEAWYFAPTDLNNFMATWASAYSLQPQDGIF